MSDLVTGGASVASSQSDFAVIHAAQFKHMNGVACVVTRSSAKVRSTNPYCSCARRLILGCVFLGCFLDLIDGIACSWIYPEKAEYKWLLPACAYSSQGQTFWPSSVLETEMAAHVPQISHKILPKCIETITMFCQLSPPRFGHHTVPCHSSD